MKFLLPGKWSSFRYEIKSVFDESPEAVRASVFALGFLEHHPRRCVRSLYFDTFEFQNYLDHVDGAGRRKKYRVRWYDDFSQGKLEVKNRIGDVQSKFVSESFPLAGAESRLELALGPVCSTAQIEYNREYYYIPGTEIRCTLDFNLNADFGGLQVNHSGVIVEVKCEAKDRGSAERFQLDRRQRFSKYIWALDHKFHGGHL